MGLLSVIRKFARGALAKEQLPLGGSSRDVVRQVSRLSAWSGVTPSTLAGILRDAAGGEADQYLTLAEELEERDLHYSSVLSTRKMAVRGLRREVVEGGESAHDKELAEFAREIVTSPIFDHLLDSALDAIAKGYAVTEILWVESGGRWMPRAYKWRDPRLFRYDADTLSVLKIKGVDRNSDRELEPGHFVVTETARKCGVPLRGGLARLVAFYAAVKSYTIKDWLAFLEVYGQPVRIGRYPVAATEDEVANLYAAVSAVGSDFAAVLPETTSIDFQSVAGSSTSAPFVALAEYVDQQLSKAVLGQTMTTDSGSSLSQAKIHELVRQDVIAGDGLWLSGAIDDQLLRVAIDLNFGPQRVYPKLLLAPERSENIEVLSRALAPLIPLGLRVSASELRERLRMKEPVDGEEILGDRPAVPESAALERTATHARQIASDKDLDAIVDEQLAHWSRDIDPVTSALEALASRCADEKEFLTRLTADVEGGKIEGLADSLARAAFKAFVRGRAR